MDLPEFLTRGEKGEIRLTGHRIDLFHVISHYNQGYSTAMLLEQYPTLDLPLIQKVMAFYRDHPAEVDAYMADVQAKIERCREAYQPGPGMVRMRELMKERVPSREPS
jgi:uncharacterized protein (DUF433 family)